MSTYEQFALFGVDSFGLERFLRFVQATCQIAANTALTISLTPIPVAELLTLGATVNLTRRFIRLWRFLSCFSTAQSLYNAGAGGTAPTLELWLDILRMSLLGMYGLLESITIPDLAGITGFGPQMTRAINLEAQRFWFVALVCGILAGISRLANLYAFAPVPSSGEVYGLVKDEKSGATRSEKDEVKRKKEEAEKEKARTAAKKSALVRKLAVDTLDLCLPTAALRWAVLDPAVVGWAMLVSTLLSGYDVWVRCGVQLRKAKAA